MVTGLTNVFLCWTHFSSKFLPLIMAPLMHQLSFASFTNRYEIVSQHLSIGIENASLVLLGDFQSQKQNNTHFKWAGWMEQDGSMECLAPSWILTIFVLLISNSLHTSATRRMQQNITFQESHPMHRSWKEYTYKLQSLYDKIWEHVLCYSSLVFSAPFRFALKVWNIRVLWAILREYIESGMFV